MVLRFVSGPMLEKSNRTGPLADRQIVLLPARLKVSLFVGFSTTRKREILKNFFGNSGKFTREIFSDFQHFRFDF